MSHDYENSPASSQETPSSPQETPLGMAEQSSGGMQGLYPRRRALEQYPALSPGDLLASPVEEARGVRAPSTTVSTGVTHAGVISDGGATEEKGKARVASEETYEPDQWGLPSPTGSAGLTLTVVTMGVEGERQLLQWVKDTAAHLPALRPMPNPPYFAQDAQSWQIAYEQPMSRAAANGLMDRFDGSVNALHVLDSHWKFTPEEPQVPIARCQQRPTEHGHSVAGTAYEGRASAAPDDSSAATSSNAPAAKTQTFAELKARVEQILRVPAPFRPIVGPYGPPLTPPPVPLLPDGRPDPTFERVRLLALDCAQTIAALRPYTDAATGQPSPAAHGVSLLPGPVVDAATGPAPTADPWRNSGANPPQAPVRQPAAVRGEIRCPLCTLAEARMTLPSIGSNGPGGVHDPTLVLPGLNGLLQKVSAYKVGVPPNPTQVMQCQTYQMDGQNITICNLQFNCPHNAAAERNNKRSAQEAAVVSWWQAHLGPADRPGLMPPKAKPPAAKQAAPPAAPAGPKCPAVRALVPSPDGCPQEMGPFAIIAGWATRRVSTGRVKGDLAGGCFTTSLSVALADIISSSDLVAYMARSDFHGRPWGTEHGVSVRDALWWVTAHAVPVNLAAVTYGAGGPAWAPDIAAFITCVHFGSSTQPWLVWHPEACVDGAMCPAHWLAMDGVFPGRVSAELQAEALLLRGPAPVWGRTCVAALTQATYRAAFPPEIPVSAYSRDAPFGEPLAAAIAMDNFHTMAVQPALEQLANEIEATRESLNHKVAALRAITAAADQALEVRVLQAKNRAKHDEAQITQISRQGDLLREPQEQHCKQLSLVARLAERQRDASVAQTTAAARDNQRETQTERDRLQAASLTAQLSRVEAQEKLDLGPRLALEKAERAEEHLAEAQADRADLPIRVRTKRARLQYEEHAALTQLEAADLPRDTQLAVSKVLSQIADVDARTLEARERARLANAEGQRREASLQVDAMKLAVENECARVRAEAADELAQDKLASERDAAMRERVNQVLFMSKADIQQSKDEAELAILGSCARVIDDMADATAGDALYRKIASANAAQSDAIRNVAVREVHEEVNEVFARVAECDVATEELQANARMGTAAAAMEKAQNQAAAAPMLEPVNAANAVLEARHRHATLRRTEESSLITHDITMLMKSIERDAAACVEHVHQQNPGIHDQKARMVVDAELRKLQASVEAAAAAISSAECERAIAAAAARDAVRNAQAIAAARSDDVAFKAIESANRLQNGPVSMDRLNAQSGSAFHRTMTADQLTITRDQVARRAILDSEAQLLARNMRFAEMVAYEGLLLAFAELAMDQAVRDMALEFSESKHQLLTRTCLRNAAVWHASHSPADPPPNVLVIDNHAFFHITGTRTHLNGYDTAWYDCTQLGPGCRDMDPEQFMAPGGPNGPFTPVAYDGNWTCPLMVALTAGYLAHRMGQWFSGYSAVPDEDIRWYVGANPPATPGMHWCTTGAASASMAIVERVRRNAPNMTVCTCSCTIRGKCFCYYFSKLSALLTSRAQPRLTFTTFTDVPRAGDYVVPVRRPGWQCYAGTTAVPTLDAKGELRLPDLTPSTKFVAGLELPPDLGITGGPHARLALTVGPWPSHAPHHRRLAPMYVPDLLSDPHYMVDAMVSTTTTDRSQLAACEVFAYLGGSPWYERRMLPFKLALGLMAMLIVTLSCYGLLSPPAEKWRHATQECYKIEMQVNYTFPVPDLNSPSPAPSHSPSHSPRHSPHGPRPSPPEPFVPEGPSWLQRLKSWLLSILLILYNYPIQLFAWLTGNVVLGEKAAHRFWMDLEACALHRLWIWQADFRDVVCMLIPILYGLFHLWWFMVCIRNRITGYTGEWVRHSPKDMLSYVWKSCFLPEQARVIQESLVLSRGSLKDLRATVASATVRSYHRNDWPTCPDGTQYLTVEVLDAITLCLFPQGPGDVPGLAKRPLQKALRRPVEIDGARCYRNKVWVHDGVRWGPVQISRDPGLEKPKECARPGCHTRRKPGEKKWTAGLCPACNASRSKFTECPVGQAWLNIEPASGPTSGYVALPQRELPLPSDIEVDFTNCRLKLPSEGSCNDALKFDTTAMLRHRAYGFLAGFGVAHAPPLTILKGHLAGVRSIMARIMRALKNEPNEAAWMAVTSCTSVLLPGWGAEKLQPLTVEEWVAGFPPARRRVLNQAWEDWTIGGRYMDEFLLRMRLFVKLEFYLAAKVVGYVCLPLDSIKPRSIQAPQDFTHVVVGRYTRPITHALKKIWPSTGAIFYASTTPQKLDEWLQACLPRASSVLESDYTMFDCTHSRLSFAFVEHVWAMAIEVCEDNEEFWRILHAWRKPIGKHHGKSGLCSLAARYHARIMNASGRDDTAAVNCLVNAACMAAALTAVDHDVPVEAITPEMMRRTLERVRMGIVGDDSLVWLPERTIAGMPWTHCGEHVASAIAQFGLIAKIKISSDVSNCVFLGNRPYPVGYLDGVDRWLWAPTLGRRLYKHGCCIHPDASPTAWLNGVGCHEADFLGFVPLLGAMGRRVKQLLHGHKKTKPDPELHQIDWSLRQAPQFPEENTYAHVARVYSGAHGVVTVDDYKRAEAEIGTVVSLPYICEGSVYDAAMATDDC